MTAYRCELKEPRQGLGLWKLNNSLLQHENIFYGLNNYIKKIQTRDPDNGLDERMRRDFLKYYIRKFSVALPKSLKKKIKKYKI